LVLHSICDLVFGIFHHSYLCEQRFIKQEICTELFGQPYTLRIILRNIEKPKSVEPASAPDTKSPRVFYFSNFRAERCFCQVIIAFGAGDSHVILSLAAGKAVRLTRIKQFATVWKKRGLSNDDACNKECWYPIQKSW